MSPPSPSQSSQPQMIPQSNFGMIPPPYSEQNVYNNNYPPGYIQNQPAFNYDYNAVPGMMQAPQNAYPMYPNMIQPVAPAGVDFQNTSWNNSVAPPASVPVEKEPDTPAQNPAIDEEKQRREGKPKSRRSRESADRRIFAAAVAKEKKNQQATLRKQREDYRKRATALRRELKTLKDQREELAAGSEPPSPTTNGFLKENDKLQVINAHARSIQTGFVQQSLKHKYLSIFLFYLNLPYLRANLLRSKTFCHFFTASFIH